MGRVEGALKKVVVLWRLGAVGLGFGPTVGSATVRVVTRDQDIWVCCNQQYSWHLEYLCNCFVISELYFLFFRSSVMDAIATAGGDDCIRIFQQVFSLHSYFFSSLPPMSQN